MLRGHCAAGRKVGGSISDGVMDFFLPHNGPGVDSSFNRNEYQKYFLGVQAVGAYGWQPYYLHMPIVSQFWEPEPPGALRACPGL